jgi:hypothetical protein
MTSFLKTRKDGYINFKFKLASIKLQDATLKQRPFDLIISNPRVNDYGDLLLPGEKRKYLVKAGYTSDPSDNR